MAPSAASSRATLRLVACGVTPSKRAALLKLPVSYVRQKASKQAVKLDQVVPFLLQSRLEQLGAHHQAAPNWQEKVVTSERLVTGQNPASAAGVAKAMIAKLAERSP